MDLTQIIDKSIQALPHGEYSAGLHAIQRHVRAAIHHYGREDNGELDTFTDAIYRCNQAFEGALKEAYRVLAEKDPSKLTPYQIENYLEDNKVIRPRALKQLTRYREDYRNPSTHDYKLDFDQDEALLAIVAVCAFTKLLTDQIASKKAKESGELIGAEIGKDQIISDGCAAESVAQLILTSLQKLNDPDLSIYSSYQFMKGLFENVGFQVEIRDDEGYDPDEDLPWTMLLQGNGPNVAVEVRGARKSDLQISFDWIRGMMGVDNVRDVVLLITGDNLSGNYRVKKVEVEDGRLYCVYPERSPFLKKLSDRRAYLTLTGAEALSSPN